MEIQLLVHVAHIYVGVTSLLGVLVHDLWYRKFTQLIMLYTKNIKYISKNKKALKYLKNITKNKMQTCNIFLT